MAELSGPLRVELLASPLASLVHIDHPLVNTVFAFQSGSDHVSKLLRLTVIMAVVFGLVRCALEV